jgi:hypothetical protein
MSKFHLAQLLHPALRWPTPVMAQDFDTGLEAAQQGISKQFFRTGFHSLSRQTSARISISHSCARVAWSYRMTIPKRSAGIVKRQNRFMPALRTISDTYIYRTTHGCAAGHRAVEHILFNIANAKGNADGGINSNYSTRQMKPFTGSGRIGPCPRLYGIEL